MTENGKPCWCNIIWPVVSSMFKLKTPIMHRVYFSTWVTSVLLSMNWSEIIPCGMIKCIFKLIQNRKPTRNMINCIFQLNCKANAANLKWNSVSIRSVRRESVLLLNTVLLFEKKFYHYSWCANYALTFKYRLLLKVLALHFRDLVWHWNVGNSLLVQNSKLSSYFFTIPFFHFRP